jgi:hypothetical protein
MPGKLQLSGKTVIRFSKRIVRVYEQGTDADRIGQYLQNWLQWVRASALPGCAHAA